MIEHRKARHDYEILETFEAGLVLTGDEVKSIRGGRMKLDGSYVRLMSGELWLVGAHVGRYEKQGHPDAVEVDRRRKLLVRKRELAYFQEKLEQKGLTLVPLRVYPRGRRLKLVFGLARGKKTHDKRETLKKRELNRRLRQGDDEL